MLHPDGPYRVTEQNKSICISEHMQDTRHLPTSILKKKQQKLRDFRSYVAETSKGIMALPQAGGFGPFLPAPETLGRAGGRPHPRRSSYARPALAGPCRGLVREHAGAATCRRWGCRSLGWGRREQASRERPPNDTVSGMRKGSIPSLIDTIR